MCPMLLDSALPESVPINMCPVSDIDPAMNRWIYTYHFATMSVIYSFINVFTQSVNFVLVLDVAIWRFLAIWRLQEKKWSCI